MQIECPVKRVGGSIVDMRGTEYHFKELPDCAHVAEVTNEQHQDLFLEIGYKIYRPGGQKAAPVKLVKKPEPPALKGSSVHPASFEIGDKTHTLAEVVAAAHKRTGLSHEEWNKLEDDARHELIDAELDFLAGDVDGDGDGQSDGDAERAALVEQYAEKFGKKPHYKWSADKIREELAK